MDKQFLLWTDEQFVGTARSAREARTIALQQDPGAMVNVCDFDQPPAAQFSIDPKTGAQVSGGLDELSSRRAPGRHGAFRCCDRKTRRLGKLTGGDLGSKASWNPGGVTGDAGGEGRFQGCE
jgi:hypothetical protein